jgi:hypothetical protein
MLKYLKWSNLTTTECCIEAIVFNSSINSSIEYHEMKSWLASWSMPLLFSISTVLSWYLYSPLTMAPPLWLHSVNRDVVSRTEAFATGDILWNWGQTFSFSPKRVLLPGNVHELQMMVSDAPSLRVVGGGHCFNSQISTDETLIDLHKMNHIELKTLPDGKYVVNVGGGAKIRHVQYYLVQRGLNIHGFGGGTHHQSIAGGISTNLHGDQRHILAQHVESLDVVLANGTLLTLGETHSLFHAVKSGMGLFGVIYNATIRVYPRQCLEVSAFTCTKEEALGHLTGNVSFGDFKATSWGLRNDNVAVHKYTPVDDITHCASASSFKRDEYTNKWSAYEFDNWMLPFQVIFLGFTDTKFISNSFNSVMISENKKYVALESGWRYKVAPSFGQIFAEYSVPYDVCQNTTDEILEAADSKNIVVTSMNVRMLSEENGTLLAYAPVASCAIEVYYLPCQKNTKAAMLAIQEVVYKNGGRSHFGAAYSDSKRNITTRKEWAEEESLFYNLKNDADPNNKFKMQVSKGMVDYDSLSHRARVFRGLFYCSLFAGLFAVGCTVCMCMQKQKTSYEKLPQGQLFQF